MDRCPRCSADLAPEATACAGCGAARSELLVDAASRAVNRDPAEAERLCTEALLLDPLSTRAHVTRCGARFKREDRSGAQADAWRAVELGGIEPRFTLLLSFPFQGEEKRRILGRLMKEPGLWSLELREQHAWSYFEENDFAGAVREYEALQADGIGSPLHLGLSYEALGRFGEAADVYRRSHHPEQAVKARMRGGDLEGALDLLEEVEEPRRRVYRAMLQALLHRPIEEPVEATREAALLALENAEYRLPFAVLLRAAGRREAARELLQDWAQVLDQVPPEWSVQTRWETDLIREILADG